jgi:hypothetical protein
VDPGSEPAYRSFVCSPRRLLLISAAAFVASCADEAVELPTVIIEWAPVPTDGAPSPRVLPGVARLGA